MGRRSGTPAARRATGARITNGRPVPVTGAPVKGRFIDYPRAGRRGFTRWLPSWRLVLGLGVLGALSVLVAVGVAYSMTKVPTPREDVSAETTIVYYSDGKTEIGRLADQNRTIVPLAKIRPDLQHAVIAAEDRTFYKNAGISPTGILRATWNNLRGRSLQGGSTITQQYVKNGFLDADRTWKRKIKEFFISVKINQEYSKDQILQDYLNTIYWGRNVDGIEAASQAYFRVSASRLTVSQSAFLAGIINAPERADPLDGASALTRATDRWNYVLDGMVTLGYLTPEQRANQTFPKVAPLAAQNSRSGQRGYLLTMAFDEVKAKLGKTDRDLAVGGYRIVTTFDKRLEDAQVAAVKATMPKNAPKTVQVAIATVDPNTGAVRAVYGGKDYMVRQQNAATQDIAQAGSTFKAFTLVAALEKGLGLKTRFDGRSPQVLPGFGTKKVANFGNEQFGQIDLLDATAHSVNTVFAQLNEFDQNGIKVTPADTRNVAIRAGLPSDTQDLKANPSNVLGSASPHPIDMAAAYATIAAQGKHYPRFVVASVSSRRQGKIYVHKVPKPKQTFAPGVMADATFALQQVVRRGTGSFVRNLGRPAAGKTGTSSDSKSAWFVGFTPQLATAVAMYNVGPHGEQMTLTIGGRDVTGGSWPAQVWTAYMTSALKNAKVVDFPSPVNGGLAVNPSPSPSPTPSVTATPSPSRSPSPSGSPSPTSSGSPSPTDSGTPPPTTPAPTP